jgi:hypothetical protein
VSASTNCLIIRWQALWQLWLGVAVALLEWRCFAAQPAATLAEAWHVLLLVVVSALLIASLALLLKPEPLVVCINYQKAQVTCYQPRLSWRIKLPLGQMNCQLSCQTSHSGNTHFLIASSSEGQAWTIQESSGWPLQQLKQLQEMLTFAIS